MYQISFQKPLHVHFIGIGGISMSGLAEILLDQNFTVTGSDAKESPPDGQAVGHGREDFLRPAGLEHPRGHGACGLLLPLSTRIIPNTPRRFAENFPCSPAPSFWDSL